MPLAVLQRLLWVVTAPLRSLTEDDDGRWRGHRTFHVDGSSVSMPDTPELQARFGQPGAQAPGCGFPTMHLLALFHATTGFLMQLIDSPLRTHDMSRVGYVHPQLQAGDILVADRGFCSFVHLALLVAKNVHGLFRAHQRQIVSFRPHRRARKGTGRSHERGQPSSRWIRRLGPRDQIVEYVKPAQAPLWMSPADFATMPQHLQVRELRFTISERGFRTREITLVTTLDDPLLSPAEELAQLYGLRWQIETNFRHLKQTMRMDVLRCKTVAGVEKELAMYALVYNLIRLVMLSAAKHQQVPPVERISFVDAARWLAQAITALPPLRLVVNPHRPNRFEPRAVKRRPKEYDRMNKPRDVLRKRLLSQQVAA